MKRIRLNLIAIMAISTILFSCSHTDLDDVIIVPTPVSANYHSDYFPQTDSAAIESVTIKRIKPELRKTLGGEGYKLKIERNRIEIIAATDTGLFYGTQSVKQLTTAKGVRCAEITDYPRFTYRGIHVDVSRHFFSKEEIFKVLDEMALYKLNNFHFHLTDNGGWRIQIDSYPKLTELGSYRVMKNWDEWWKLDKRLFCTKDTPGAYGGFFTKDDIREIVEYAKRKFINVIPEIEFPAHSDPVFVAYPELNCTHTQYGNGEFCPANEDVYKFAEAVLTEIMELFPSKVIHIGADEARRTAWETCPACHALMEKEGIESTEKLQCYMVSRLQKFLNDNGRSMGGWDQVLENDDIDPSSVVYSYRGEKGAIHAANKGIMTVMTPGEMLYFDWYQANSLEKEPKGMYGYSPLKKMYVFDPTPITAERAAFNQSYIEEKDVAPDTTEFIRPEMSKYVIGVQGCSWAEYIDSEDHLEYMMFPRILAISEKGWSPENSSDWTDFRRRVGKQLVEIRKRGIKAYDLHNEPEFSSDGTSIEIESENLDAVLRYTTDGTDPTETSAEYSGPFILTDAATIKAAAFVDGKLHSYIKTINFVPGTKIHEYYYSMY